jgi:hypothetical protein
MRGVRIAGASALLLFASGAFADGTTPSAKPSWTATCAREVKLAMPEVTKRCPGVAFSFVDQESSVEDAHIHFIGQSPECSFDVNVLPRIESGHAWRDSPTRRDVIDRIRQERTLEATISVSHKQSTARQELATLAQHVADACLAAQTERYTEYEITPEAIDRKGQCDGVELGTTRIAVIDGPHGLRFRKLAANYAENAFEGPLAHDANGYHYEVEIPMGAKLSDCANPTRLSTCVNWTGKVTQRWQFTLDGDELHGQLDLATRPKGASAPRCRVRATLSGRR